MPGLAAMKLVPRTTAAVGYLKIVSYRSIIIYPISIVTASTKLAPQENRQGYINGADCFYFIGAPPLTVSLLAASGCLSDAMACYVQVITATRL
jgi:hypothetical protein